MSTYQYMPSSRAEAKLVDSKHYFTARPCKNFHFEKRVTSNGTCFDCIRHNRRMSRLRNTQGAINERKRNNLWKKNNPEKTNALAKKWKEQNPEKVKEMARKKYQRRRKEDLEGVRRYARIQSKRHVKIRRFNVAKRNAQKRQAMPEWISQELINEIKGIYSSCPDGHEVDHIIPLISKTVCGLHVPCNLQHLEAEVNWKKSNNYDPTKASSTHTPYITIDRE